MIHIIERYRKGVAVVLLPLFLLLSVQPALAGDVTGYGDVEGDGTVTQDAEDVKSTNVRWHVKEDVVIINYDLIGDPAQLYSVEIVMKREGDESFSATPQTVEGHIGEGYYSGTNREIRWYFRRDYPQGFQGEGYYFESRVEVVGKDYTILYYALGAAAVIGGLVAVIVGQSQEEPPPVGLPAPPVRP